MDEAKRRARAAWAYSGKQQDELAAKASINAATLRGYLGRGERNVPDPRYAEAEEEMYAVLVRFAYDKADAVWTGHSTLVREALRRASNMPEGEVDALIETARVDWQKARDLERQLDEMREDTDAGAWARGLLAVMETGVTLDEELLTGWFANAFGLAERAERGDRTDAPQFPWHPPA